MSAAAAVANEPETKAEDFKVHTTGLKRKEAPTAPTTRNTRARLDKDGTSSSTTTAKSTTTAAARPGAARAGAGRGTAARGASATARAGAATRSATTKSGVGARNGVGARAGATTSRAAPAARTVSSVEESGGAEAVSKPKKKRPAWDLKGRLQDLEEGKQETDAKFQDSQNQVSTLSTQLEMSQQRIDELAEFRRSLESKVQVKEKENSQISQELTDLQNQLRTAHQTHQTELHNLKSQHKHEVERLSDTVDDLKRKKETLEMEVKISKEECFELRSQISKQSAAGLVIETELRGVKSKLEQTEDTLKERDERIVDLESALADARALIGRLESKVREEESIRRKLHNTIQELKGNIRVFCRVRPPLEAEKEAADGTLAHMNFKENEDGAIELYQSVESASSSKQTTKTYPFTFDKVFRPESTQSEVFEEISQLVQSALDGYNVCIFAYGQTGSGKTFTMEGPPLPPTSSSTSPDPTLQGMIPRTVQQIFDTAEALKEKGWEYSMEGTFLEIYNEVVRDLLEERDEKAGKVEWGAGGGVGGGRGAGEKKYEIRHLPGGRTVVEEAVVATVKTPSEVHRLLRRASHNRAVASTLMNERSSRSHSIFSLRLTGQNSLTGETSSGVLNLIDLAGSERLDKSGSGGDKERLKETQAINRSLSALGDVVERLGEGGGEGHVPFRNSKLTYLLQNSLGGNSKTLMFVNVSPLEKNFGETLCSLRFATKVNSCQIGTAKKNL
ncbi:kinesin-like nuclear fusion protein, partial [Rhizophlyctis rosea]